MSLEKKFEDMQMLIRELHSVAVAFSAGIDSTFVLKVSLDVLGKGNVVAVTGDSPSLARQELELAEKLAGELGAEHVVIRTDEFNDPCYTGNPSTRCYYCKVNLYRHIQEFAERRGLNAVVDGANIDDDGDWRPGQKAAIEYGVISPVARAGINKQELRVLSKSLGLSNYDKPASPCLSSRIPYGQEITREKLKAVNDGENYLKRQFGFSVCRVRHYGDYASVEVLPVEISRITEQENRAKIEAYFKSIGFGEIRVDPRGFRSGALNEVLDIPDKEKGL